MDFTRDQLLKVGIFAVLGVTIMGLFILFLGQDQKFFTGTFQLKTQFPQAQGLNRGSVVSLAGIRVGTVANVTFARDSQDLTLSLEIDETYRSRLTEGSLASVRTMGALGDRFIYISPGPLDAKPLADGSLIPSDQSPDLFEVIAKKGPDIANVGDLIKELGNLVRNLNHENQSRELMENLIATSRQLKILVNNAQEGLDRQKFKDTITHLENILAKIDRGDGTLGALINDPTLHQKLMSLVGDSSRRQILKPVLRENVMSREKVNGL